jgi:CRISPR-associated protein Cmr1
MEVHMKITIQTLTPLWTGGVDQTTDRLHETGLLGSLRWWYEALARGLGGYACDPTSEDRCPDKDGKHCAACELFGCTGWARKFRLIVGDHTIKIDRKSIKSGQTIHLRFVPLRTIQEEERCLLALTVNLISEYGAFGGKTIFKPSDETNRQNQFHHTDFGLVQIRQIQSDSQDAWHCTKGLDELKAYVTQPKWRSGSHIYRDSKGKKHDYSWASLKNFWCVKGRYLARQNFTVSTFNKVIGREEEKRKGNWLKNKNDATSRWLAGSQQESKKVFSFRHPNEKGRTFGFVKPGLVDFEAMKKRLTEAWLGFDPDKEFLTGEQILNRLASENESGGTQ